jgi:hypothetical protein
MQNSYIDNRLTGFFSGTIINVPEMEHDLFPTEFYSLLFLINHNILQCIKLPVRASQILLQGVD